MGDLTEVGENFISLVGEQDGWPRTSDWHLGATLDCCNYV